MASWKTAVRSHWETFTILLCLYVCALALRLIYLYQVHDSPLFDALLIDSETYDRFAQRILKGQFKGEEVYSVNILYPYFLALIYAIAGRSWITVGVVQALLDAINAVLIYLIAARMFDRRVGLISGGLAAVYGPFIFFSSALLTPVMINFFLLLTLWLLALHRHRPRWHIALGAGLCLGLATLGRGNSLLLFPLSLAFFHQMAASWRKALAFWLIFGAGTLFLPSAVTVRNYYVEGKFVPIAANYGAFYAGHHPEANGLYTLLEFSRGAQFEEEVLGVQKAIGEKLGRPVTLAETSQYLLREGLRHIVEHPWTEVKLAITKFYFFWNTTEPPTNLNYYFAKDFSTVLRYLLVTFGIVAPLGLLGIFLSWRDWRNYVLLYVYISVYLATCLTFYVSAEYRLPAVSALLVFAAFALVTLFDQIGAYFQKDEQGQLQQDDIPERPAGLSYAVLTLLSLFAFCNYRTPLLKNQSLKRVDYLNFGTLYTTQGEFDKAKAMLDQSLRIDPAFGTAYRAYAELQQRMGNSEEAARYANLAYMYGLPGQFGHGLGMSEENTAVALKANEYYQKRDYANALRVYEELGRAFAAADNLTMRRRNLNNIGLCHYKLGNYGQAEIIFRRILQEDSTYVLAYTNLAKVLEARNELQEAAQLYEKALLIDPHFVSAQKGLQRTLDMKRD